MFEAQVRENDKKYEDWHEDRYASDVLCRASDATCFSRVDHCSLGTTWNSVVAVIPGYLLACMGLFRSSVECNLHSDAR